MLAQFGIILRGRTLRLGFGIWIIAELCAFLLVVEAIGLGRTLLLGFASSGIGLFILTRLGRDAAADLQRILRQGGGGSVKRSSIADRTLTAIGALLLIVPGFLSDLAGLALLLPIVRGYVAKRVISTVPKRSSRRKKQPGGHPEVIELQAGEWQRVDERKPV